MALADGILSYQTPRGSAGIWWLGQNGYIFKSHAGTLACVDLYLTNSCDGIVPGVDLSRRVPVLIEPEDLQVNVFTCTHNHQDHTDPETIRRLTHKAAMQFVGPHPSCEVFLREGVALERIVPAWPGCDIRFRDIRIRGTFAVPTDASDLNHMGFVFDFEDGPTIWVTGDTDFSDLLSSAAKHNPDVMIVCINGGFNNLSHWEAAELAAQVKPRIAVPCHYDLFPDNAADPRQFRAALKIKAPDVQYLELKHGEATLVSRA